MIENVSNLKKQRPKFEWYQTQENNAKYKTEQAPSLGSFLNGKSIFYQNSVRGLDKMWSWKQTVRPDKMKINDA